jgi:hypothetical protein
LIIILDSNEYINYLNKETLLLQKVFLDKNLSIWINDHIIREVLRNIKELQKKEFYNIIFKYNINFYGLKLPIHLLDKYKNLGFKKGDIVVAAFCKSVPAEYLISENRHFLRNVKIYAFKVVTLKEFVNNIGK